MKRINLIPLSARKASAQGWFPKYILRSKTITGMLLLVFLLAAVLISNFWAMSRYKSKIALLKSKIKQVELDLENSKEIQARIKKDTDEASERNKYVQKRLSFLEGARKEAVEWSEVLLVLTKLTPANLWLGKISLKKDMIALNGTTVSNDNVSDFMLKLDQSGYFKETNFNFTQKNTEKPGQAVVDFEITTHLAKY